MSMQFRNRKLRHLFRVFDLDADRGLIKDQFVRFADELARAILHVSPAAIEQSRNGYRFLWGAMREHAAPGGDRDRLELDDFLAWGNFLNDAVVAGGGGWMARWSDPQFALLDVRGEGEIGIAEYAAWCHAFELAGDPDHLFRQLDEDGDGVIRKDEFLRLTLEFLTSESPSVAGNLLWGHV
jgi:hypothetical protein